MIPVLVIIPVYNYCWLCNKLHIYILNIQFSEWSLSAGTALTQLLIFMSGSSCEEMNNPIPKCPLCLQRSHTCSFTDLAVEVQRKKICYQKWRLLLQQSTAFNGFAVLALSRLNETNVTCPEQMNSNCLVDYTSICRLWTICGYLLLCSNRLLTKTVLFYHCLHFIFILALDIDYEIMNSSIIYIQDLYVCR